MGCERKPSLPRGPNESQHTFESGRVSQAFGMKGREGTAIGREGGGGVYTLSSFMVRRSSSSDMVCVSTSSCPTTCCNADGGNGSCVCPNPRVYNGRSCNPPGWLFKHPPC